MKWENPLGIQKDFSQDIQINYHFKSCKKRIENSVTANKFISWRRRCALERLNHQQHLSANKIDLLSWMQWIIVQVKKWQILIRITSIERNNWHTGSSGRSNEQVSVLQEYPVVTEDQPVNPDEKEIVLKPPSELKI